jgi:hypothetical protein
MKANRIAYSLCAVAFGGALLTSCERPTEERETGSPATQVSPSVPVPQPTTTGTPDAADDDVEEP